MRLSAGLVPLLAGLLIPAAAHAQYYGLYLACEGTIVAGGKRKPADLSLAMRDNNETALIQSSNVLPVGQTVRYRTSQQAYTVNYAMPGQDTAYWNDWYNGWILAWEPNFKQVRKIEMTIDRTSGKLSADLQNIRAESLGRLSMTCTGKSAQDLPPPKF